MCVTSRVITWDFCWKMLRWQPYLLWRLGCKLWCCLPILFLLRIVHSQKNQHHSDWLVSFWNFPLSIHFQRCCFRLCFWEKYQIENTLAFFPLNSSLVNSHPLSFLDPYAIWIFWLLIDYSVRCVGKWRRGFSHFLKGSHRCGAAFPLHRCHPLPIQRLLHIVPSTVYNKPAQFMYSAQIRPNSGIERSAVLCSRRDYVCAEARQVA